MRRRYFDQAELVCFFINFVPFHQLVIRQEFKVAFDLTTIDPGKRIKPLKDQHKLREQDIDRVLLPDMNFFMQQDLVVGLPFIFFRVDKNDIAKGAGSFIARYFNDAVRPITNRGIFKRTINKYTRLEKKAGSEYDHSKPINENDPVHQLRKRKFS